MSNAYTEVSELPSSHGHEEEEDSQEEQETSGYAIELSVEEQTLFQLVRNKRQKQEDTCQQWLEHFAESPEQALITFIEFILEASGSQYQLPLDVNFPLKFNNIIIAATLHFGKKSPSYPLNKKGNELFKRNVIGFVQQLLRLLCKDSLPRSDFFLKTISDFLMVCTDSKVRAFRHTSTLIALKMMTTLNELPAEEREKMRQTWLQMFGGIFMLRSRDVFEDIRYLCISECGLWLEAYPASLLLPLHLKHLFKALQDRCSKVCESSLRGLLKLSMNLELQQVYLEQGIKYRMTLLGLIMSVESEVSQLAIELLLVFYKAKQEILDSSMLQVIEQLVFAAHRGVAQIAAKFITHRHQEVTTDKERILVLVQLFISFGEHEHAAYLVDAFYDSSECLLAWSTMVAMLQEKEEDCLNSEETSALIEIMTRAVQQAVTGEVPPGRYTEDLERQPLSKASKLATKQLLPQLPSLIQQFSSSPENLRNILELPQYMSLQKGVFLELLEQIMNIMYEQVDQSVLEMGAMTLEYLCDLDGANCIHRKELLNNAVTNYMIAYNAWVQCSSKGTPAKNISKRLLHTLRLVSVLYARFDLNDWKMGEKVLAILKKAPAELCLPEEAHSFYLSILYLALCWDLKRLQGLVQAEECKNVEEDCLALRGRLEGFFVVSFNLMEQPTVASTACEAFVYCCDLFVVFADRLRESGNASIQSLEYRTKLEEYELLEAFMMRYVFPQADKESAADLLKPEHFEELQIKRRVLTGYLKLIFHNVMPMMRACIVFQYYESHYAAFGDIMRATMEHSLSVNPTNYGMTVMHTCLLVYKRIRLAHEDHSKALVSVDFVRLIRLANLLAELFNVKRLMVRPGILILHRAGIRFAVECTPEDPVAAPKNLLYLTVVQQFVPQLLAQDMLDIYKFLQFIDCTPLPTSPVDAWQPLTAYRNALVMALRQSCRRDELADLEK